MSKYDRGGQIIYTGKIGILRCLRQQLMFPGETIRPHIQGKVRLETLRERDAVPINARMDIFLTPVRWLWSDYPTWLREGPASTSNPPTETATINTSLLGIGPATVSGAYTWWRNALLRVYNEHFKHPEATDLAASALTTSDTALKAVPLPISWSRVRSSLDVDNNADKQFTLPANRNFDIRTLREVESRYISAMQRENMAYERWIPMLRELYGSSGSNEVDQVPFHVGSVSTDIGEREMAAMDGPSLGKFQTLLDFKVNFKGRPISAGEHCILTYTILLRYPSVSDEEGSPFLGRASVPIQELQGDPTIMQSMQPEQVQYRHFFPSGSTSNMGFLPFGWRHRTRWNCVDDNVRARATFPLYRTMTTLNASRNADNVNVAFRSTALQDYVADLWFTEISHCMVPTAAQSLTSGMTGRGDTRQFHTPFTK